MATEISTQNQTLLINYLVSSLKKTVPGSHAYTLYLIFTRLECVEPLTSSKNIQNAETDRNIFKRRILVLITEKIKTNPDRDVFVTGIEIHEYYDSNNSSLIVYISKVDTTGFCNCSVTPTKNLLSAYMNFYSKNERSKFKSLKFHCFARSQPEYLFQLSAKNPIKRKLEDPQLIKWWKRIFQQTFFDNQNNAQNDARGWFYLPGVSTERNARMLINDLIYGENEKRENQFWKYGYPYPDAQKAIDVIPKFEDDAKSRWLSNVESEDENSLTVKEFWDMISIGGEFVGGNRAGFIWVEMKGNDGDGGDGQKIISAAKSIKPNEEKIGGLLVDNVTYNLTINTLLNENFQSESLAIESTSNWKCNFLEQRFTKEELEHNFITFMVENPLVKKEIQKTNVIPVNNLQMSIKRKNISNDSKIPSSVSQEETNISPKRIK
ncbi:hypothetical protein Glove_458g1 [Diversispora epigaea]|uniref:histone acetyltransferase n=1 Tax=Diversispora epigaea TaxID=1348612 RepID=A0A397GQ68_9GLOM|nr:hypothetical protein Glove_458g1 [Diversispora epigaea]